MLTATIVIDNIADEGLTAEWGFCVLINSNGIRVLLDTGASEKYLQNVEKLGIDLSDVDYAVLSHAHYDHSGGYRAFFSRNDKAKLYVSACCAEDCYAKHGFLRKYIGIPKGILSRYADRIERAEDFTQLADGIYLVSHQGRDLSMIGQKAHMYRKIKGRLQADDFSHEQSLVFSTAKGLVVFNSCSHAGIQNIVNDVAQCLPGQHIHMIIGGMHLCDSADAEVHKVAGIIKTLAVDHVITGHCTGDKAYAILKEELGEHISQTSVGLTITVPD